MKIRTDFVTNSSSASYVTIHVKSKEIAEYLTRRMNEIKKANDSLWGGAHVYIEDSDITISAGDCDSFYIPPPTCLNEVIESLLSAVRLTPEGNEDILRDSIEQISWESSEEGNEAWNENWGNIYDRNSYDPDALQIVLKEIADAYQCSPEEVTDEMFCDYMYLDRHTEVQYSTFEYSRKEGKSRYHYHNPLHIEDRETDERS